jgi:hypothetical protein
MTSLAEEVVRDKKTLDYQLDVAQSGPATFPATTGVAIADVVDVESSLLYGRGGLTNHDTIKRYSHSLMSPSAPCAIDGLPSDDLASV